MHPIRWLRAPVSRGGTTALGVLVLTTVLVFAVPILLPAAAPRREQLMLSGIGLWSVLFGVLRPRLLCDRGIMEGWRFVLGDRGLALFYIAFGAVFAAGMWRAVG